LRQSPQSSSRASRRCWASWPSWVCPADGGDALISALHAPSGAPGQTLLEVWRAAKVWGHQLQRPEQQRGGRNAMAKMPLAAKQRGGDNQPMAAKQKGGDNQPMAAKHKGLQAQAAARGLKPEGGEKCPGCPGEPCSARRLAGGKVSDGKRGRLFKGEWHCSRHAQAKAKAEAKAKASRR
jgi:hypothetical protein